MTLLLLENAPIPAEDPVVRPPRPGRPNDPLAWRLTEPFVGFFTRMASNVNLSPAIINDASLGDQAASIAATDLAGAALPEGRYSLMYWLTIVQAASVSSSIQITFSWTYRAVTKSASGAAITSNLTSANQSGSLPMFVSDGSSPITYATTYASSGATALNYDLFVALLRVRA